MFCPGLMASEKFLIIVFCGLYPKVTLLNLTSPLIFEGSKGIALSSVSSVSSRNSNTLSAAATVDCNELAIWAVSPIGCMKDLTY